MTNQHSFFNACPEVKPRSEWPNLAPTERPTNSDDETAKIEAFEEVQKHFSYQSKIDPGIGKLSKCVIFINLLHGF